MESNAEGAPLEVNLLDKSMIEVIRDYTQVQDENSPIILVNPAHENEPYVLGTAIAADFLGKRK